MLFGAYPDKVNELIFELLCLEVYSLQGGKGFMLVPLIIHVDYF